MFQVSHAQPDLIYVTDAHMSHCNDMTGFFLIACWGQTKCNYQLTCCYDPQICLLYLLASALCSWLSFWLQFCIVILYDDLSFMILLSHSFVVTLAVLKIWSKNIYCDCAHLCSTSNYITKLNTVLSNKLLEIVKHANNVTKTCCKYCHCLLLAWYQSVTKCYLFLII